MHESVKALPETAFIPQAKSGRVGFWEENSLAKRSPKKTTRDHAYNQNGYDTRPRDRIDSRGSRGQTNKSDDAIIAHFGKE